MSTSRHQRACLNPPLRACAPHARMPAPAVLIRALTPAARHEMERSAWQCVEATARLARRDRNVVTSMLRGRPAQLWRHYPENDARDAVSGLSYYYHSHRQQAACRSEHGHFHVFLRRDASAPPAHIVAIAVDAQGLPLGACTTNRWITGEKLRPASTLISALRTGGLETSRARRNVDCWLSAVLHLFSPQIAWLLHRRDALIAAQDDREQSLEDRRIETWSRGRLSIPDQIQALSA